MSRNVCITAVEDQHPTEPDEFFRNYLRRRTAAKEEAAEQLIRRSEMMDLFFGCPIAASSHLHSASKSIPATSYSIFTNCSGWCANLPRNRPSTSPPNRPHRPGPAAPPYTIRVLPGRPRTASLSLTSLATPLTCSAEAGSGAPIAQTGSYAKITSASPSSPSSTALTCPSTSSAAARTPGETTSSAPASPSARESCLCGGGGGGAETSPTQTRGTRPLRAAAAALRRTRSSDSPKRRRRSAWPTSARPQPSSRRTAGETSPVYGPSSAAAQSWAPTTSLAPAPAPAPAPASASTMTAARVAGMDTKSGATKASTRSRSSAAAPGASRSSANTDETKAVVRAWLKYIFVETPTTGRWPETVGYSRLGSAEGAGKDMLGFLSLLI